MPESCVTQNTFNPTDYFYRMEDDDDNGGMKRASTINLKTIATAISHLVTEHKVKEVEINETWEKLWVSFMVFHPKAEHMEGDEMLFTCQKVGANNVPMKLMRREFDWMVPKYGKPVHPW
jgi:hypothetical protein